MNRLRFSKNMDCSIQPRWAPRWARSRIFQSLSAKQNKQNDRLLVDATCHHTNIEMNICRLFLYTSNLISYWCGLAAAEMSTARGDSNSRRDEINTARGDLDRNALFFILCCGHHADSHNGHANDLTHIWIKLCNCKYESCLHLVCRIIS